MALDRVEPVVVVSRKPSPIMCLPGVITVCALVEMQEWRITESD
jgi:hypothetical protein